VGHDDTLVTLSQAQLASMLREVAGMGGRLRFQAHGRSMRPFVRSGDTLVVEPLGGRRVRLGDILLYGTPSGGVAAHRVTGRRGGTLRCRGDSLAAPLELVDPDRILGRVAAIERRGRLRPSGWLRAAALGWIAIRPGVRACRRAVHRVLSVLASGRHPDADLDGRRPLG
jgi:hypothetical protein